MSRFKYTFLLFLTIFLCSCDSKSSLSEAVYTQVAETYAAQATSAILTITPDPTHGLIRQVTATLPISTTVAASSPIVATAVKQVEAYSGLCDNSVFISDISIPDGTIIAPGVSFIKTWKIQNTGTCIWSTSYALSHISGDAMSGATTVLTEPVSSGGQAAISINMVAPSTAGTYIGYWRMQNSAGTYFGQTVYVQITVSSTTATATETPTATSDDLIYSETATEEITSTIAATSTPIPANTPTSTPEPTKAAGDDETIESDS